MLQAASIFPPGPDELEDVDRTLLEDLQGRLQSAPLDVVQKFFSYLLEFDQHRVLLPDVRIMEDAVDRATGVTPRWREMTHVTYNRMRQAFLPVLWQLVGWDSHRALDTFRALFKVLAAQY